MSAGETLKTPEESEPESLKVIGFEGELLVVEYEGEVWEVEGYESNGDGSRVQARKRQSETGE